MSVLFSSASGAAHLAAAKSRPLRLRGGVATLIWRLCCDNFGGGCKCTPQAVAAAFVFGVCRGHGFVAILYRQRLEAASEEANTGRIFVGFSLERHRSCQGRRAAPDLRSQHGFGCLRFWCPRIGVLQAERLRICQGRLGEHCERDREL